MGRAKGMNGAVATAIRGTDEGEGVTVLSALDAAVAHDLSIATLPPAVISAPERTVTVKVENFYICGEEFDKVVKVQGPLSTDEEYLDEWWDEVVFEYTGGHSCEDCDSDGGYAGTITKDTEAPFVGLSHEWF